MTTCAYRDGVLAFDTQATCGGLISRITKGFRLPDGSLFAGAGAFWQVEVIKAWCESGRSPDDKPKFDDDDDDDSFGAMHIRDDGLWIIDSKLSPYRFEDDFYAIGSGSPFAFGAMDRGASAEESVHTAARFDCYTSAPVRTLKFTGQTKPNKARRK